MGKEALIAQTSVSEMKVGFILVAKNVPLLRNFNHTPAPQ